MFYTFGKYCTLSLQAIGVDTLLHMFLSSNSLRSECQD